MCLYSLCWLPHAVRLWCFKTVMVHRLPVMLPGCVSLGVHVSLLTRSHTWQAAHCMELLKAFNQQLLQVLLWEEGERQTVCPVCQPARCWAVLGVQREHHPPGGRGLCGVPIKRLDSWNLPVCGKGHWWVASGPCCHCQRRRRWEVVAVCLLQCHSHILVLCSQTTMLWLCLLEWRSGC